MSKNYCEHCGNPISDKITYVHFILDKSGSMESVREATISGFNEYIGKLQNDGNKYRFDFTLFDTESIEVRYENSDIHGVKKLNNETYKPNGGTPLYDAVCGTIKKIDKHAGYKHLVIIMTDGEENASKEYKMEDLKQIIKDREGRGNWTFVFLGANQDSWSNAQKYGMSFQNNTSNFAFSNTGVRQAFSTMSASTTNLASMQATSTSDFFSPEQKQKLSDSQ